jgi:hypothetical protein
MGEVMGVVFFILGLMVAWPCLVVWVALAFPQPVDRARLRLERSPTGCFFLGAGLALVIGGTAVRMITQPTMPGPAKLLGWIILFPLLLAATIGSAGLVQIIGDRIRAASGPMSPLGALIRGAVITELAALFPVAGWFFFWPLTYLVGLGSGTLGLFTPSRRPERVIGAAGAAMPGTATPPSQAAPAAPVAAAGSAPAPPAAGADPRAAYAPETASPISG